MKDSRWKKPLAPVGLWGSSEEPERLTEAPRGDAVAEDEPAESAVSPDQQTAGWSYGKMFLKSSFMELDKKMVR